MLNLGLQHKSIYNKVNSKQFNLLVYMLGSYVHVWMKFKLGWLNVSQMFGKSDTFRNTCIYIVTRSNLTWSLSSNATTCACSWYRWSELSVLCLYCVQVHCFPFVCGPHWILSCVNMYVVKWVPLEVKSSSLLLVVLHTRG